MTQTEWTMDGTAVTVVDTGQRMKRRHFVRTAGIALAAAGLTNCGGRTDSTNMQHKQEKKVLTMNKPDGAKRLNVLLIMTDEQCADAMSCVGNPHLKTPNMDRLARNGVRFEKAYTTQPLCVPYRTSLQTGRWPHQTGVMVNNTRFLPSEVPQGPILGKLVREAGYQCGYLGKMHICHLQPDGSRSIDLRPDGFELHGYDPVREGTDPDIAPGFMKFLKDHPDDPFFFTASFDDPHNCLGLGVNPNNLAHIVGQAPDDPAVLPPLPKNHLPAPDEPEVVQAYWDRMEARRDKQTGRKLPFSDDWNELQWRQYIWAYYRLIEKVDKDIGDTLDVLDASGRAADTLILFTVDHGDGAGRRRRRCKQVLYDECARVPFIVSGAGVMKKGTVDSTHLISAIDIVPTILDYTGAQRLAHVAGQSLRPLIETGIWDDHPYVITQTLFNKGLDVPGWAGRMVRTPDYKYILYNHGQGNEQLFDMNADPLEMHNLAKDPQYQSIRQRHREMLEAWCAETDDKFLRELDVPCATEARSV